MSAPTITAPATASGGVPVGGSGAAGYLAKWTAATTLGGSTTTGATASPYVDATGNVGIGTASPGTSLHVVRAGTTDPAIIGSGSNSAYGNFESSDASRTNKWTFGRDNAVTGNFVLAFNSSTLVSATSTGNVGIGTTSPASKLDVNGAANVTGALTVAGSVSRTSGSTAGVANGAYIVVPVPQTYKALLLSSTTTSNETLSSLHLIGSDVTNCNVVALYAFQTTVANNGAAASVRITNASGGTATIKWSFLQIS